MYKILTHLNIHINDTCNAQKVLLLPVCIKYTAQDDSRVANIARGEAKCGHKTLSKSCIISTNEVAVFQVFYCILHLLKCQQNKVPWSF